MPFQFLCPQGHWLQGDESQMGLQTQCPLCGVMFLIPHVTPQAGAQFAQQPAPGYQAPGYQTPGYQTPAQQPAPHYHAPEPAAPQYPAFADEAEQEEAAPQVAEIHDLEDAPDEIEPVFLHIPCPNGHELETPFEMLGQDVLCPHCGAQFLLREEDSVEHRAEQEERERQRAHMWFNYSIAAAVIVVVSMLAMVVVAMRS